MSDVMSEYEIKGNLTVTYVERSMDTRDEPTETEQTWKRDDSEDSELLPYTKIVRVMKTAVHNNVNNKKHYHDQLKAEAEAELAVVIGNAFREVNALGGTPITTDLSLLVHTYKVKAIPEI